MRRGYKLFIIPLLALTIPLFGAQDPKKEKKTKGYLGVQIQDVTSKIEKRFKLPNDEGAYIDEVVEDSPAEKGGLKDDDVVLSFAGKTVYDADDLSRFVSRTEPDTKVDIIVWRDGAKKTLSVMVGKRKERSFSFRGPEMDHNFTVWAGRNSYGIELSTLTEQLGAYFGVPGNEGVLVESVKEKSAAAKAGLKAGDVITMVGKEKVARGADVLRELSDYEEGDKVDVEVFRKGSKKTVTIEIEEDEENGFQYFFDDFGGHPGAVIAPRMRMHFAPEPDVDVDIDRFPHEELNDLRRELKEAIEIHAPAIRVRTRRITL